MQKRWRGVRLGSKMLKPVSEIVSQVVRSDQPQPEARPEDGHRKYITARVEWDDASSDSGWIYEDGFPALTRCVTVGKIVHMTDNLITIAATITDDGQFGEVITIPRATVVSLT